MPEEESKEAGEIIASLNGSGAVSTLTDVEIASVLHRRLSAQDINKAYCGYRHDRQEGIYQVLAINEQVLDLARILAERHAASFHLRSLDIMHLATALHHGSIGFATYDGRLGKAAAALGLKRLPLSS